MDETDIFEDVNTGLRRGGPRVDVANFLAMFEHKLNHFQVELSPPSCQGCSLHSETFHFLTIHSQPVLMLLQHTYNASLEP